MKKLIPYLKTGLLLTFCIAAIICKSQNNSNFTYYTTSDGLPANRCFTATMDSKGFLWVGTEFGLSRFDGLTFKNYRGQ